jgi:hypothetical protein
MATMSATAMANAPPEPPSPITVAINRHLEFGHHCQIPANGLGLPALFGIDSGICPRRIDKGKNRHPELLRQSHQRKRLAVAFGTWHAEIPMYLFLGVASLLVPDHHAGLTIESRQTTNNGVIVRISCGRREVPRNR